jgi:hypothetical protein
MTNNAELDLERLSDAIERTNAADASLEFRVYLLDGRGESPSYPPRIRTTPAASSVGKYINGRIMHFVILNTNLSTPEEFGIIRLSNSGYPCYVRWNSYTKDKNVTEEKTIVANTTDELFVAVESLLSDQYVIDICNKVIGAHHGTI